MLSTLLTPTAGEAIVAGCDLRREPKKVRERIGYVGQRNGSDPGITARQELEFQARLYGASSSEAKKRTAESSPRSSSTRLLTGRSAPIRAASADALMSASA